MPKMLYMGFANSVDARFDPIATEKKAAAIAVEAQSISADPNPFNRSVRISIRGPIAEQRGLVVRIYDSRGQLLESLARPGGAKSVTWSADRFPPGLYIARASAGKIAATKRIFLVK
jgi:hypothetical protein